MFTLWWKLIAFSMFFRRHTSLFFHYIYCIRNIPHHPPESSYSYRSRSFHAHHRHDVVLGGIYLKLERTSYDLRKLFLLPRYRQYQQQIKPDYPTCLWSRGKSSRPKDASHALSRALHDKITIHNATRFWCLIGHNKMAPGPATSPSKNSSQPNLHLFQPDKTSTVACLYGWRVSTNNRDAHPEKGPGIGQSQNLRLRGYEHTRLRLGLQHCRPLAQRTNMQMHGAHGTHAHSSTSKLLIHKPNRLIEGHEANSNPIMAK